MAIELVNAESAFTENLNSATMTHAYTCAVSPGNDRLLVAFVTTRDDTFPTNATVAYNGVTMTVASSRVYTGSTPDRGVNIYYLLHADIPNDGAAHNFTINADANYSKVLLAEYKNVAQAAQEDADSALLTTGDAGVTLTVSNGALLLDCWTTTTLTISPTFGQDQVKLGEGLTGASSSSASHKLPAAHSGGDVAMSVASTSTAGGAYCAAAWAPAAGAPAGLSLLPPRNPSMMSLLVR